MAYLVWDASQPKPDSPECFKAYDHQDAARQFAQLYWDMGCWRVDACVVDDEDGDVRTLKVRRIDGFEVG